MKKKFKIVPTNRQEIIHFIERIKDFPNHINLVTINENILKRRLLNGERIILGVKVDNSYKIIEDTLNPFQFAYDFIGVA